jgi:competence protein ComEC
MADNEQRGTRAGAWAAEVDAARRRAGITQPDGLAERAAWLGRLLSQWAIAEVAPGRLMPWLAVSYGLGIVVYFTADREPMWWAAVALALAGIVVAILARRRVAPYGVIANLLAMPVVSVEVMPMGILGLLAMPFGFDAIFWKLMGAGVDWMDDVALWVASLPGAVGHVRAFGTGPRLLGTAAILLLCLLRTTLRWSGAVLALVASVWALNTHLPDVLVSGDEQAAAVRGADGRLAVLYNARDSFAIKEWLAADEYARADKDASLHDGVQCDAVGCIGRLADGRLVSFVLSVEGFAEDCARAAVVVSAREAPRHCAATLIDRNIWRANGAVALRWTGDRFALSAAPARLRAAVGASWAQRG